MSEVQLRGTRESVFSNVLRGLVGVQETMWHRIAASNTHPLSTLYVNKQDRVGEPIPNENA